VAQNHEIEAQTSSSPEGVRARKIAQQVDVVRRSQLHEQDWQVTGESHPP
jgi:hypothetical protein